MAQLDPNTSTRRQFTECLITREIPAGADATWSKLVKDLQALHKALAYHPAMSENIDDPFMTPAKYKNKVYFMWDFVGRTLGMALQAGSPSNPAWDEALGRAAYATVLINDTSGKLEIMCPDERGQNVQFGQEVKELADKLASDE